MTSDPAHTPASTPTERAAAPSAEDLENMPLAETALTEIDGKYYLVIQPPDGAKAAKICPQNTRSLHNTIMDYPNYPLLFKGKIYGYDIMQYIDWHGVIERSPFSDPVSSPIHFLGNIKDLNVSNLTSLKELFQGCDQLRDISGLSTWNTSNVTNTLDVFSRCSQLRDISPLKNWDTSKVKYMDFIFDSCSALSDISPLSNWNIQNLTNTQQTFSNCTALQSLNPLSNWDVKNIKDLSMMFESCTGLQGTNDLSKWTLKDNANLCRIFQGSGNDDCTIDFSNKVFYEDQDPNDMISGYKGVLLGNNWDVSKLSEDNLENLFGKGHEQSSSPYPENLSCLFLTDNNTILDKLKDTSYTTQVTVQQGDRTDSITLPAVYDSRIDDSGEVNKTKPASKDPMKIVQTQFNKALRTQLGKDAATCKSISSSWPGLSYIQSLPKNYALIPGKNIDPNGSPTQLFKTTYHIAETKEQTINAKTTYWPSSALAYGIQKVLKAAKDGTKNVALGGMDSTGDWNPKIFTVLNTVSAAQDGIVEIGNVEETKTVLKYKTMRVNDPNLEKGQAKVITPGKDGETVVKKRMQSMLLRVS